MTRAEFYGKSVIITIVSCLWVYFSEDKEPIIRNLTWGTYTLAVYLIWSDLTILHTLWTKFISEKVKP